MRCVNIEYTGSETNIGILAFIFDSSKIDDYFYGDVVFKYIIEGKEILKNSHRVVFSEGDIADINILDDIWPFAIKNKYCTISNGTTTYKDFPFCFLLEDIDIDIAIQIDKRLKFNLPAYIGMTTIDVTSTDQRKQFWKNLIRSFSIEMHTITAFGTKENSDFMHLSAAKENGYNVIYDEFPNDSGYKENGELFSTRQSLTIKNVAQLQFVDGKSDSDRGKGEMNFALVKETEIAGLQIWKSIEDINQVYISKDEKNTFGQIITDYIFTSLYQAAQGVERLQKILIELLSYDLVDKKEKDHTLELLLSHNHPAMYDYIAKKSNISLNKNCKKLINLLSEFYNKARYHRYSFSKNDKLELKLIRSFGSDIGSDDFDQQLKHRYGKTLGKIAQTLYDKIYNVSTKLCVYVYELNFQSVAQFVLNKYFGEDIYKTLKRVERSKRELIWYLMNKGKELTPVKLGKDVSPLPFEQYDIDELIQDLISDKNSCLLLHNFVSDEYDNMVGEDKHKWMNHVESIDTLVGNPNVIFDDSDNENM